MPFPEGFRPVFPSSPGGGRFAFSFFFPLFFFSFVSCSDGNLIRPQELLLEGRPEEALLELEATERDAGATPESGYWTAKAQLDLGDLDGALISIEKVLARRKDNAEYHFLKGVILHERGQYLKSNFTLLAAERLDPDSFGISYYAGLNHLRMGDWGEAEKAFGETLVKRPRHLGAVVGIAEIRMAGPVEDFDRERTLNELREALKGEPENLEGNLALARFYVHTGNTAAAVAAAAGWIERNGEEPAMVLEAMRAYRLFDAPLKAYRFWEKHPVDSRGVRILRAKILIALRDYGRAEELIAESGLGGEPEAALLRARILMGKGNFAGAVAHLRRLNRIPSQTAEAYGLLARAYLEIKDYGKAASAVSKAISLDPGNPRHRLLRAQLLIREGRLAEAMFRLEQLNLPASHPRASELLGDIHFLRGETASAREAYERIQADEYRPRIGAKLVYLTALSNEGELAEKQLNVLLRVYPDNFQLNFARAKLLILGGEYREALAKLKRVKAMEEENGDAYLLASRMHHLLGEKDEAFAQLEEGVAAYPLNLNLIEAFAFALDEKGRHARAIPFLRELASARPSRKSEYLLRIANLYERLGDRGSRDAALGEYFSDLLPKLEQR